MAVYVKWLCIREFGAVWCCEADVASYPNRKNRALLLFRVNGEIVPL